MIDTSPVRVKQSVLIKLQELKEQKFSHSISDVIEFLISDYNKHINDGDIYESGVKRGRREILNTIPKECPVCGNKTKLRPIILACEEMVLFNKDQKM